MKQKGLYQNIVSLKSEHIYSLLTNKIRLYKALAFGRNAILIQPLLSTDAKTFAWCQTMSLGPISRDCKDILPRNDFAPVDKKSPPSTFEGELKKSSRFRLKS